MRRHRYPSKREWLRMVKPLMEAPPSPPIRKMIDIALTTMPKSRRMLVYEYGMENVRRALNATSSEDPLVLEEWLKVDRERKAEAKLQAEPMK